MFNKEIAYLLSEKLDMYFLDLPALIDYELIDKEEIVNKCGLEYFNKLETNVVENASTFENTVIYISHDLFFSKGRHYFDKNLKIYLAFDKNYFEKNNTNIVDNLAFADRDKFLKKICNVKVELKNKNKQVAVSQILKKLKEVC